VANPGKVTGAAYGAGEVKETTTMAKSDLERKVSQAKRFPYLVKFNSWLACQFMSLEHP
jgi:hypothetical protein